MESQSGIGQPGGAQNPNGGYHIHIQLNEHEPDTTCNRLLNSCPAIPPDAPILVEMSVFEDCVIFTVRESNTIVIHVDDPRAMRSVVFFYHADGTLWRAVPLEQLNPSWVFNTSCFRGDLRKFDVRLARMRSSLARPSWQTRPMFWVTAGWRDAVVYVPLRLVWRIHDWQPCTCRTGQVHSHLPEFSIATPNNEQVERLSQTYPADVQRVLAVREETEEKDTYQIGGLSLLLNYVEHPVLAVQDKCIGLVEIVNRYCLWKGDISDGTVIALLVINRLLSPCALSQMNEWVNDTGLHVLLGIDDPELLNYYRLADALFAIYPHWQTIATEITLRAVEEFQLFQLKIDTIHYDLTSVFFHGKYEESEWVTFGYSRDKRPDKRQVNIGISATADGEVALPGGSSIHPGNTNDGTTVESTHQRLHQIFQRSDLLVSGDSIMNDAQNMLLIGRIHGRFLGAMKLTPYVRGAAIGCREEEFETCSVSTKKARHEIKATFRRLHFRVKVTFSPAERKQVARWRKRHGIHGRIPQQRQVRYWVRAAIILDTARQQANAKRRIRLIEAYEQKLEWTLNHLGKGRYYGDHKWVSGHLVKLTHQFKAVCDFVRINFTVQNGVMNLLYCRRPSKINKATRLDGKWVLVTNQRCESGQHRTGPNSTVSLVDYMDWMWGVYKNHRHVERRMRNLKSDLPIRPIYLHRDDAIVSLCFVSVIALMVYTLIERDCQSDPVLAEAGLRTTDKLLVVLGGFCLGVHLTPSGYEVFWLDTPTEKQKLIWRQLQIPNPGTCVPDVSPASQKANSTQNSVSFLAMPQKSLGRSIRWR
ncbi:MAG: hypothetical protein GY832_05405 [Chloroflexi bacterium]|nr:hypothetical protein [Chloroflexota bacterium]